MGIRPEIVRIAANLIHICDQKGMDTQEIWADFKRHIENPSLHETYYGNK